MYNIFGCHLKNKMAAPFMGKTAEKQSSQSKKIMRIIPLWKKQATSAEMSYVCHVIFLYIIKGFFSFPFKHSTKVFKINAL